MVRLSITLNAVCARELGELIDGLQFHVPRTRLELGCVGCEAWSGEDSTVHYVEDWATEADIRRRVVSDRFTSLLAVVESAAQADVRFEFVTETRGIEYVLEARAEATGQPHDHSDKPGMSR
jgi:hypothetical protein